MTHDELLALRRTCPECGGTGTCDVDLYLEDGGAHICVAEDCETCAGTGYVLPATEEVLAMAGDGRYELPEGLSRSCPPGVYADCNVPEVCCPQVALECWRRWLLAQAQTPTDGQEWQCAQPAGAMIEPNDISGLMKEADHEAR